MKRIELVYGTEKGTYEINYELKSEWKEFQFKIFPNSG